MRGRSDGVAIWFNASFKYLKPSDELKIGVVLDVAPKIDARYTICRGKSDNQGCMFADCLVNVSSHAAREFE